jgi:GntR family transcriptional regulator
MANVGLLGLKLPLHTRISEELRERIIRGEYAPGDQLPSEHHLMALFNVSRITVRRAIANLASQGLVSARHGKGVFVKEQRKAVYSLSSPLVFFEQEIHGQGAITTIRNLVFEPVEAPDQVRALLKLPFDSALVYLQKKLLLINGMPVALDISYILPELGQPFAAELQNSMTFPILERHDVAIEKIEATFESTRADRELSTYLDTPLGEPLLVYCYTAYTKENQPILCGTSPCRGDRLSYSVVLTKSDR